MGTTAPSLTLDTGAPQQHNADETATTKGELPHPVKTSEEVEQIPSSNSPTGPASETKTHHKSEYMSSIAETTSPSIQSLVKESVYDMLDGLPRAELKLVVEEAKECERALKDELEQLKIALERETKAKQETKEASNVEGAKNDKTGSDNIGTSTTVSIMLESDITPPDQYWTVSALLGRLRHELTTPLPPNSQIKLLREQNGIQGVIPPPNFTKRRKSNSGVAIAATDDGTESGPISPSLSGSASDSSQFRRLQQVRELPDYKVEHDNTDKLMAVWKKISSHRSAHVFRRPVNPKDAPGYADRIHFPMDMSLIRKLIANRTIRSYSDIAQRIHLICHNCVKYNGRESDYALVTREFESFSTEFLINATLNHGMPYIVPNPAGRPGKKKSGTPTTAMSFNGTPSDAAAAASPGESPVSHPRGRVASNSDAQDKANSSEENKNDRAMAVTTGTQQANS